MPSLSRVVRFTVLLVAFFTSVSFAVPPPAETSAAASQAPYPLKTCLVSGGKLGSMGRPVAYVYQQAGQPDRTVFFCCKSCIKKFEKEPARFLAKLDAAGLPAKTANR